MKFYTDLHIHSKYSRATSKDLNPENLYYWAQLKGIDVVGTGDFVHPEWLLELKKKLEPAEEGFYKLKASFAKKIDAKLPACCKRPVRFMLSLEVSSIYKKTDKVRKVHNVCFAPSFESADKIQKKLSTIGNIHSDGRPILGLDSHDLLEIILETNPLNFLVPAHIWTPWFSVLGSKSGFDSIKDCYGDLTKYIYAIETGLSSDPLMNWRLKQLDSFALISNSDAHSASKLAREATIFDTDFSYRGIFESLSSKNKKGLLGTIEFFPEEGKYHYDGHRSCQTCLNPKETIKNKGQCPVCGKPVTVGVLSRVEALSDREEGEKPKNWKPYYSLIPLTEIIATTRGVKSITSKAVQNSYHRLLNNLGCELFILQEAPIKEIEKVSSDLIAKGVKAMREGSVNINPGYDGEFGKVSIPTHKTSSNQ